MTIATRPAAPSQSSSGTQEPSQPRVRSWWLRALLSVVACLIALLAGGGIFNWLTSFKQEPPRQEDPGVAKTYSVTVFQAEQKNLQRVITAFGTAVADREVVLSAEVSGQVVEVHHLEVGRNVRTSTITKHSDGSTRSDDGDLLVRIDPQTYQEHVLQTKKLLALDDVELEQLDQQHENNQRLLKTEQANFKTSQTEYENALKLEQRGVGTSSAVRRAELDLRRYEDAVIRLENELSLYEVRRKAIISRKDAHQSDLELANLNLKRTQVRPPFTGVLSEVFVEAGQYVRPGEPLVRLTDPRRVEIPLSLTLSDYLAIAALRDAGRQVRVALAENETTQPRWFSDPVEELRQAPEADERTRTVKVYTEVDNHQQEVALLPGTFVHARITGPILAGAIVIPRDALVEGTIFVAIPESDIDSNKPSADNNPNTVLPGSPSSTLNTQPTTQNDSWFARVERRRVTAGRTLQSLVLIEQGLSAGEWVVTTNLDVLFDGARLKIDPGEGERCLADQLAELRSPQVQIVEELSNTP